MKNRLVMLIVSVGLMLFMASANAEEQCPDVSKITTVGVTEAEQWGDHWIVGQTSRYDLANEWLFAIFLVEARDKEDALNKAKNALSTLTYVAGPTVAGDKTFCKYSIGGLGTNVQANAISPPK